MHNCSKFIFRRTKYLNINNVLRRPSNRFMKICLAHENIFLSDTVFQPIRLLGISHISQNNLSRFSGKRKLGVSNIIDLRQYINEGKQFYLKLLINILDVLEYENISDDDAQLLLECCGQSVADSAKQKRDDVCQKIYQELLEHKKLNISIYNIYIRVCTENGRLLNSTDFLKSLTCQPNQQTYKLLLDNVCEKGDIDQAYVLLKIMRDSGMSADEEVFNKLVLGYTINKGLEAGESVLLTMRTAKVPETTETNFSILRGVAKRNSIEEFENVLLKYKIQFTESHILKLLEALCLSRNISWLSKVQNLQNMTFSREFTNNLEKLCIHLIHMGEPESSMTVYKTFVDPSQDHKYASVLLKEMLHCNIDIERILSMAKQIRDENLNAHVIENLTEIALKYNYTEESWRLLQNLNELRTHFFWPLLVNANKKDGETGVFAVLQRMTELKVKIDSATLQSYVLPFFDIQNFKYLVKKLSKLGLTVSELVASMVVVLLQKNSPKEAANLCNIYNVPITGENFVDLLSSVWTTSKEVEASVILLQKYCESNMPGVDLVGEFLIKTLNRCKIKEDFTSYLKLIELVHKKELTIDSTSASILHSICSSCKTTNITEKIRDQIDSLLNFAQKSEVSSIPHPRNMKLDELECHLVELQEKGMETRGVLRKLILLHSNFGNVQRVEELRQQFLEKGYDETVGMKSSLMHSYVKGGHLEGALNVYKEIKSIDNNFGLDSFKIIDLATLLIKKDRFKEAMDLMQEETKAKAIIGGPSIERNCRELLGSFTKEDEQQQMFDFLVKSGYCKPTNVILGPLVRIHLNRDLHRAVDVYIDCTNKFKCTPLQLEIVCKVVNVKDEQLLDKVLKATENVHGVVPTQEVFIAALAENGHEHMLTKFLDSNKITCKQRLEKRCERWIQQGKVEALQTLMNACNRLRDKVINVHFLYRCIVQSYSLNGDIRGAREFYENLLEKDVTISKDLEAKLNSLINKSKAVKSLHRQL